MHGSSGAGRAPSSTLRFLPRRPGTCAFWRQPGTLICAPIQQLTALSWGAAGAGGAGRCVQVHTDRGCAALQPQFSGWQRQHLQFAPSPALRARPAQDVHAELEKDVHDRTCTQRSKDVHERTCTQRSKKDVHAALEKDADGALEKDEKCCWRSRLAARARCCWRSRLAARARAASQTPHVRTQGFPGGRVPCMHAECCSKFVRSCARAVLIFLPCMHAECCFVRSCVHARF